MIFNVEMLVSAEINRRRLRPAMPNGALIDTVTVSSPETDVYTVTMRPFDCGNQFPLFELTNGAVSGFILSSIGKDIAFLVYNIRHTLAFAQLQSSLSLENKLSCVRQGFFNWCPQSSGAEKGAEFRPLFSMGLR